MFIKIIKVGKITIAFVTLFVNVVNVYHTCR